MDEDAESVSSDTKKLAMEAQSLALTSNPPSLTGGPSRFSSLGAAGASRGYHTSRGGKSPLVTPMDQTSGINFATI